jgi:diadenylate cyclase
MINFNILTGFSEVTPDFSNPNFIADLILCSVFIILFTVFVAIRINRLFIWLFYGIIDALFIISFCFGLEGLALTSLILLASGTIVFVFINSGVVRKYVAKPLKSGKTFKASSTDSFDKEKLIENVCMAVNWLSANKVGALITFERNTPLNDFMKSGTIINCPFTPELVETIFYEGTRLHDGAIIVKNDTIVAAAVYYPPSTKTVVGKFGARHRAALGISEITDSITIVVSEETGRISIAHAGMLDNVKTDEFDKVFRNQIAS